MLFFSGGFSGWKWINPDGSDPQIPFNVTVRPEDLNEFGIFPLMHPTNTSLDIGFVATKLKLSGVSGQLEDTFVDFIGTQVDDMPYDGWKYNQRVYNVLVDDVGTQINQNGATSLRSCRLKCEELGHFKASFWGIRKISTNKYGCICMDRMMTGLKGGLKDAWGDPLKGPLNHYPSQLYSYKTFGM